MSTYTVDLPATEAESLGRFAKKQGINETEMLRKIVAVFFERNAVVDSAMEYVLNKNEELYQRLAK